MPNYTGEALRVSAMLCDHAEVAGQKLFVAGAGVNLVVSPRTEPPHLINIALALLVTVPWGATNQGHRLQVELLSDGEGDPERVLLPGFLQPDDPPDAVGTIIAKFNAGRAPHMLIGESQLLPIAIPLFGFGVPTLGPHHFEISLDGNVEEVVRFRVLSPPQLGAFGLATGMSPS